MVLDEYFKVCYNVYKRQMRIWILLAHKYLKTAQIEAKDRRFVLNELVNPDEKQDLNDVADGGKVAQYPIEFSHSESQQLGQDLKQIKLSLDNIFKGTTAQEAIGQIQDIEEAQNDLETAPIEQNEPVETQQ